MPFQLRLRPGRRTCPCSRHHRRRSAPVLAGLRARPWYGLAMRHPEEALERRCCPLGETVPRQGYLRMVQVGKARPGRRELQDRSQWEQKSLQGQIRLEDCLVGQEAWRSLTRTDLEIPDRTVCHHGRERASAGSLEERGFGNWRGRGWRSDCDRDGSWQSALARFSGAGDGAYGAGVEDVHDAERWGWPRRVAEGSEKLGG